MTRETLRAGRYCYPSGGPSSAGASSPSGHCPSSSACLPSPGSFRSGRGLFTPVAGLFAVLLLGSSVFFLAYMVNARAYTLIALCAHDLPVELLARRPAPATARQGRAGWPSAWECWTALVALLWRFAPARAGSISPALRPEEPSLVATCCPLRTRRPDSNSAVTHFIRGVKHSSQ